MIWDFRKAFEIIEGSNKKNKKTINGVLTDKFKNIRLKSSSRNIVPIEIISSEGEILS